MDTIFMNSKNSGTFDPHRLLLNRTDKINLNRSDKDVPFATHGIYYLWHLLCIYYIWQNIKK